MKVGDLVEDRHYGVGVVEHVNPDLYVVTVHFAQVQHLAPGGRIRLMGWDQVKALKIISSTDLNTTQAMEKISSEVEMCDEIKYLLNFIKNSKRGVTK